MFDAGFAMDHNVTLSIVQCLERLRLTVHRMLCDNTCEKHIHGQVVYTYCAAAVRRTPS